MSGWRVVVRRLNELDGPAPFKDVDDPQFTAETLKAALQVARRMGFVASNGERGRYCRWQITDMGRAWCEGRIAVEQTRNSGGRIGGDRRSFRYVSTWLASLPRDIRIQQREPEAA